MEQTNYLLQEILQEIREVKAHVIPAPNVGPAATFAQSSPAGSGSHVMSPHNFSKMLGSATSNERAKIATVFTMRKANRTPEEQAKINDRVAKMKAARMAKKSSAGGEAESYSTAEERTRKRKIHRNRTRKA